MKNLKYDQNCCRLNIEIAICTKPIDKVCPYGTYLLLRSLERVLRGCNVLLRSLKSLMSIYIFVR